MKSCLADARILATILALLAALATRAADIPGYPPTVEGYDPREMAMIPSFCIHTMLIRDRVPGGRDVNAIAHWRVLMGPSFDTMHHYCWGLMKTNRALLLAHDQATRDFYLDSAVNEFNFVLQGAQPDFFMIPEILTKKGENLIRLRKPWLGIPELERAAELKPDYWPPYAYLSDYYKNSGELEKARETLERGLGAIPEARALKSRLAELDRPRPSVKK